MCVRSLTYPACNAHVPYCHLCPVRLYNIFPHYLINGTIFRGGWLLNVKSVFWFSLQILPQTFAILRRISLDTIINVVSLKFFIDIILPVALWPWGWQPLTEWVPGDRCVNLHVPIVLKFGGLNLLETSGPLQACNGTALPLPLLLNYLGGYKFDIQDEV